LYVLDSCSLLNLVASRRLEDIVRVVGGEFAAPDLVADEVKFVRRGGNGPDAREHVPVDIVDLQDRRILTVRKLDSDDELRLFLAFASQMDDGEAAACAVAFVLQGTLVTDDRRARRIMSQRHPTVSLMTTSELVKAWVDMASVGTAELIQALTDIEERGSFQPGNADPLLLWWRKSRGRP
jgi:predicted nucleic acid-binding protein